MQIQWLPRYVWGHLGKISAISFEKGQPVKVWIWLVGTWNKVTKPKKLGGLGVRIS